MELGIDGASPLPHHPITPLPAPPSSLSPSPRPHGPASSPPTPNDLRTFLSEKLPDYMLPAAFVSLAAMPLTSNGKVDRKALPVPTWESVKTGTAPQTAVEHTLADIWAAVLRLKSVGVHDNFFELGGDSILALQMVSRAAQAGILLSPQQIFQHQTISELAAVAGTTAHASAGIDLAVGEVPLTPIQRWFFEQNLASPHHFNQAVYLELPPVVDRDRLNQAIQQVMTYHDVLRLRFKQTDEGWRQHFAVMETPESPAAKLIPWFDLSSLSEGEQAQAIATHANELQSSLNLESGPLVQVGGFDLGFHRPSQLLIVIHHMVVDGLSWRILLEDLLLAYRGGTFLALDNEGAPMRDETSPLSQGSDDKGRALTQGVDIFNWNNSQLPPKTQSFKQWALWLQEVTNQCKDAISYWRTIPRDFSIPVDFCRGENNAAVAETVTIAISPRYTQALLQEVPSTYNTQINDVLLTALVKAFADWTGKQSLLITLENYGRHPEVLGGELNLSHTVGWFTCLHPLYLELASTDPGEQLKAVKAQLRQLPHQGLSYGLLRYEAGVEDLSVEPPVSFNYLGQFDAFLTDAEGFCLLPTPGATSSPQNRRLHLIDINGWIRNRQLQLEWSYSRHHYRRSTVESLAQRYLQALQLLIDHCQFADDQGYTPEDFSLAQLDQATLNAVLGKVRFQGGAGK